MKRILVIPPAPQSLSDVRTYDLDTMHTKALLSSLAPNQDNPYFIAQKLITETGDVECTFTSMVKTPISLQVHIPGQPPEDVRVMMFVDENGSYTGQQPNVVVSHVLYPAPILGPVMLAAMKLVYTDEGPDYEIVDNDWSDFIVANPRMN
jgi:hypothetical protein